MRWAMGFGVSERRRVSRRFVPHAAVGLIVVAALAMSPTSAVAADDGKIAYGDGGQIWVLSSDGSTEQITDYEGPFASDPRWSSDGTKLAWLFFEGARVRSIVIADADGSNQRTVVEAHNCASPPAWSPDGATIAGTDCSVEDGNSQLFVAPVAGGTPTAIATPRTAYAPDFSPDGSQLVFEDRPTPGSQPSGVDERDSWDLATVNLDGSGYELVGLADGTTRPEPAGPAWRPTGDAFAYQFEATSSSCAQHVRIADASSLSTREVDEPEVAGRVCGVSPPRWNSDGEALTYVYCDTGTETTEPECHVAVVDEAPGATAERILTFDSSISEDRISRNAPDWHGTDVPGAGPATGPETTTTVAETTTTSRTPASAGGALVASSTSVVAGGKLTVSGGGFAPHSPVTLTLFSDPVDLGTATTGPRGRFSKLVTIPSTVPAGQHRIVATGSAPDGSPRSIEVAITVRAAATGTLPATGGHALPVVAAAVLIVASLMLRSTAGSRRDRRWPDPIA